MYKIGKRYENSTQNVSQDEFFLKKILSKKSHSRICLGEVVPMWQESDQDSH